VSAASEIPGNRRLTVFVGAFGSGKTEIAIHYALLSHAAGRPTALVDLDIVNPYFRAQDHRAELEGAGVRLIGAPEGLDQFEVPALSPEIAGVIGDRHWWGVFDVGGDPIGARTLGGYSGAIAAGRYDLWVVVNPYRPDTRTPAAIETMIRRIEAEARLSATGVVANPHLGTETSADDIAAGLPVIREAAARVGLPIIFVAAIASLAGRITDRPVLPLTRRVRTPWE